MPKAPRAVIDLGSNSVLLLIGTRGDDGEVSVIDDRATITGLGRGAAKAGKLDPAAVQRTLAALRDYGAIAQSHGIHEVTAVATEGLRLASDPTEFLAQAEHALGSPVRLISGDEEAELSYRSVAPSTGHDAIRVIDVGGASTELVVGEGATITERRSHRIGSVRLTERFIDNDPPTSAELEAVAAAAAEAFATQPVTPHPELHGLAGTVTTAGALMGGLAHYDRERIDNTRFSLAQVLALRDRLATQTTAQRMESPLLPAGRADVITAGVTIVLAAMKHCGASTLVVRDRGLRYALL